MALPVFLIAGLLADEAQLRADRAFAQHSALSAGTIGSDCERRLFSAARLVGIVPIPSCGSDMRLRVPANVLDITL